MASAETTASAGTKIACRSPPRPVVTSSPAGVMPSPVATSTTTSSWAATSNCSGEPASPACGRSDSLTGDLSPPGSSGHEEAQLLARGGAGNQHVDDPSPVHDGDPVCQGEDLVELHGDQENARPLIPSFDDP